MGIYTRLIALVVVLSFPLGLAAQKKKRKKKKEDVVVEVFTLSTYDDTIAYALGMGTARNIMNSDIDSMNIEAYTKGFEAVFMSDSTLIEKESIQVLLTDYFQMKKEAKIEELVEKEKTFLAENKLRPEVDTTVSGLQYEVITPMDGPKPNTTNRVTVHYEGKLIDGTIFDSSYKKGKPIQFNLGGVIAGWTEGLQLMSPGSKYIFYIPHQLGYGANPMGAIPPYSTLIFTVELISIDE